MSVSLQTLPQDPGKTNLNEFFVPAILNFSLEKTSEERSPEPEANASVSRQHGDPFLKPVDAFVESNKENPVLKALFGGKSPPGLSPWTFVTKTSLNNCHPFKKTELSHDLAADDTPAEVPKSLLKKASRVRKRSTKEEDVAPEAKDPKKTAETQKITQLDGVLASKNTRPTASLTSSQDSSQHSAVTPTSIKKIEGTSLLNKRKKIVSSMNCSKPRTAYVNSERLFQLRMLVDNAIKNHKIYSMTGTYNSVRNALKQRGWIEKIDSDVKNRPRINKFEEIGICVGEAEIINRMLKNVTEDLCWLSRPFPYYSYKDFEKFNMINRLPRAYFSNKVGLCNSLQQIQWYYETGVCSTQFPRTYNMSVRDELQAFKDDFRMTACIGLLKWFLQGYKSGGEKAIRSSEGKIDMNIIEFALRRCAEYIKTKQHEDIDIQETQTVWEYQWDNFISQYYKVVNEGQLLKENKDGISIKAILSNVQSMLNIIKPYWPQYDVDGYQNFWIVKPGGRCCGAGIIIKNNLEQILVTVNPNSLKETRYVVQKYIERPLLIYNTKFDIRQWFLVTSVYPLTVWMYKECYLRFCSQPFTLKNTHESIHLCNNAVQKKYKNGKRDRGLPDENMWDCFTFQTYLKALGYPDVWDKYIYPGMKESFVGALLASQENMERRKNCFELYGADFMISDTLTDGPWLIEINSNPAMDSSTSVTARMCPQVLEDIIKVVIDRRDNRCAPTGGFELVYRQHCPPIPPYLGMSFCIKGRKAFKANGDVRSFCKKSKSKTSTESLLYTDTEEESASEEIPVESEEKVARPEESPKETKASPAGKNAVRTVSEKQNGVKQCGHKRRKVDWVRKNIKNVKCLNSLPGPKKAASRNSISPVASPSTSKIDMFHLLERMDGKDEEKAKSDTGVDASDLKKGSDDGDFDGISEDSVSNLVKILKLYRSKGETSNVVLDNLIEEMKETGFRIFSRVSTRRCPGFNAAFERELEKLDCEKNPEDDEADGYHVSFGPTGKTSVEYFQDWRSKLTETRQNCEEMLTKLHVFQEENSKSKFQRAIKKTLKNEVEFIKRLKKFKNCRVSGVPKQRADGMAAAAAAARRATDDARFTGTLDCDDELSYLAINTKTGAVRSIGECLPRVKERGAKGHVKKVEDKPGESKFGY